LFFFLPFFYTFNTTFLINKNENIPHKIREAKTTNKKKEITKEKERIQARCSIFFSHFPNSSDCCFVFLFYYLEQCCNQPQHQLETEISNQMTSVNKAKKKKKKKKI